MHQLVLGVACRNSGDLFESATLFNEQLLELLLPLGYCVLVGGDGFSAPVGIALALLEQVILPIELTFPVVDAALCFTTSEKFSPTSTKGRTCSSESRLPRVTARTRWW
jgi:hypothetical protein